MKVLKNSVHLMGNLGKEIELTTFSTGTKKATTSLATTEYHKNQKGESIKNTQWHTLVAWGKTAEQMAAVLHKGNTIVIYGSINYRSYPSNGQTKTITEILISDFIKVMKSTPEIQESQKSRDESIEA